MRRLRIVWRVALLSLGAQLAWGAPAQADERAEARRAFRSGMQAISDGEYDAGIALLEQAYESLPHPNVLYNLGLAHMHAGRAAQAIAYFERYKESVPPDQAQDVDALIAELNAHAPAETPPVDVPGSPSPKAPAPVAVELKTRLTAAAPPVASKPSIYDEEVVSTSRFASTPLDAAYSTAIISAQEIRMTGLTGIADLLRRVAGVDVTTVSPAHAEVAIRGLNSRTSNKVLLLVDGRSRRLDFLGASWFDQLGLAVDDIERIEVVRGPASQIYGADAFSGVVNIITRAPGVGRSQVSGTYGSDQRIRATGQFTGRSGRLSYRAGMGHDEAQNYVRAAGKNRVDVQTYGDSNLAYARTWANGELRYELRPGLTATTGGAVSYAKTNTVQGLSRLLQVTAPNDVQTNAYAVLQMPKGFRLATYWDGLTGNAGASVYSPDAVEVIGRGVRQHIADVDLSWSNSFTFVVPHRLTVGGGYRYKFTDWIWFGGDHQQHHYAAYLSDALELAKPLTLHLGGRLDRHPLLASLQISPRAALVYRFTEGQALRASVGRAFRGPTFLESYLALPTATPERGISGTGSGNRRLDPESIISAEIGYVTQALDYLSLELNAYYNSVKDAILFTDVQRFSAADFGGSDPRAAYDPVVEAFPISVLSFTNERASFDQLGGELGARVNPLRGLDLYANYGLHDTSPHDRSKIDSIRARQRPTSLHKVNAGIQYRAPFGLDVSADVSWLSKQRWVEQQVDIASGGVRFQAFDQSDFLMVNGRVGMRLFRDTLDLGVVGTNLAFQQKRQHPFAQPLDTRVLGTAKLRF
jgi:outer membrane receptor for ferrienterochelin and colicin